MLTLRLAHNVQLFSPSIIASTGKARNMQTQSSSYRATKPDIWRYRLAQRPHQPEDSYKFKETRLTHKLMEALIYCEHKCAQICCGFVFPHFHTVRKILRLNSAEIKTEWQRWKQHIICVHAEFWCFYYVRLYYYSAVFQREILPILPCHMHLISIATT